MITLIFLGALIVMAALIVIGVLGGVFTLLLDPILAILIIWLFVELIKLIRKKGKTK